MCRTKLQLDRTVLALLEDETDAQCDCACLTALNPSSPLLCPLFYYLELTPACNNRCPGCSNVFASDRSSSTLSAREWRMILAKLEPYVSRLKITGGEPTIHPEFATIVSAIRDLDIPFALFTNARWSEPSALIALLQAIPQCRGLLVSLHGAIPTSHDAFTDVPGAFEETAENVQWAIWEEAT